MSIQPTMIISAAVFVILVALGAYALIKHPKRPGYYNLFIIGIVWIIIGAVILILGRGDRWYSWTFFLELGIIYTIIGYANKAKWPKR